MNIEEVRNYALSMNGHVTERLFADKWLSWRIGGKWFLLTELDTPDPWVAVKLEPEVGEVLREHYEGVRPAYHMNKRHWSDLVLRLLSDDFVREHIKASYDLVVSKLPKRLKADIMKS